MWRDTNSRYTAVGSRLPLTAFVPIRLSSNGKVLGAKNQPFSFTPVHASSLGQNSRRSFCLRSPPAVLGALICDPFSLLAAQLKQSALPQPNLPQSLDRRHKGRPSAVTRLSGEC